MSEVRVVDLKELGVSKEVFDKIYSMGEQDGRADVIEEFREYLKSLTPTEMPQDILELIGLATEC